MIRAVFLLLVFSAASCGPAAPEASSLDVLVFGPHPDDAAIGCTGVMVQAIERGGRVGVVVVTNGDGYVKAAAQVAGKPEADVVPEDFFRVAGIRQRQSRTALGRIGVRIEDHEFLGYPDSGMEAMRTSKRDVPYRQPYTLKDHTYGIEVPDYHSRMHGAGAPYVWDAAVRDAAELITARRPKEIYVTDGGDRHPDHRAVYFLVRDAVRSSGYSGPVFTYRVHGSEATDSSAPEERPLDADLVAFKKSILREYAKNLGDVHADLHLRALPVERFWRSDVR